MRPQASRASALDRSARATDSDPDDGGDDGPRWQALTSERLHGSWLELGAPKACGQPDKWAPSCAQAAAVCAPNGAASTGDLERGDTHFAAPAVARPRADSKQQTQSRLAEAEQRAQPHPPSQASLHGQPSELEANNPNRKNLDSGYAWLVLVVMFLLQSSISGASRVYGIVYAQQVALGYYDREQASWPIASASFVENLAGLLTPALANLLSWRQIELLSTLLFVAANLLAYASDSLWLDILALGLVQGLALATSTVLSLAINNDYFERYRTSAYGIAMSGSAFGVLYLSPLVSWLLERHQGQFRIVYLALALVFCVNILLVLFIKPRASLSADCCSWWTASSQTKAPKPDQHQARGRKISLLEEHFERKNSIASISYRTRSRRQSAWLAPGSDAPAQPAPSKPIANDQEHLRAGQQKLHHQNPKEQQLDAQERFSLAGALQLLRSPYLHCTWIMLALYYLIARVFVIILVDFADDHGFSLGQSTQLLNYWSLGELVGRVCLGSLIDLQFLSCRACISLTCTGLASAIVFMVALESYQVYACCACTVAALISLEYMLINVLMVEYLGKQCVTSCYSLAAFICSAVLFARPTLIGLFRDRLGSYDGLLLLLAALALAFGLMFGLLEPLLVRQWPPSGKRLSSTSAYACQEDSDDASVEQKQSNAASDSISCAKRAPTNAAQLAAFREQ